MSVEGFRTWLDRRARIALDTGRTAHTRIAAGVLAFVGLGFLALVRLMLNVPFGPSVSWAYPLAITLATVAPAIGLLAIGVRTERPVYRVGLTFAGVFGLLAVVAEPATLPATLAIGAAVLGLTGLHLRDHWRGRRFDRWLVAGALGAGTVVSLAAGIGLEPSVLRPLGSRIVLLAIAATPVFVNWDREAVLVGLGVGVAVVGVGLGAPFLSGAVALIVGGVVGASLPLLVVAAVGAVILFWAAMRSGETELALAAGVLLVAGIPATVPRALAVLTAIALLGGRSR